MPYEFYAPIDFECGCRINTVTSITGTYTIYVTSKSYIEDTICAKHEMELKEKFIKAYAERNETELRETKARFEADKRKMK